MACIDVAAAFYDQLDPRKAELFTDTCHMTRAGYVEVAQIVTQNILQLNLIPEPPASEELPDEGLLQ